jgi:hypothetical protein
MYTTNILREFHLSQDKLEFPAEQLQQQHDPE